MISREGEEKEKLNKNLLLDLKFKEYERQGHIHGELSTSETSQKTKAFNTRIEV